MGNWGVGNFYKQDEALKKAILFEAVTSLSPKARQAMYAAAKSQIISRGTWNGCAFNAASGQVKVTSYEAAAEHFGMTEQAVYNFISAWDNLPGNAHEANAILIDALEKNGLWTESTESRVRVVVRRVFTSEETRMKEEFDKIVDGLDFDVTQSEVHEELKQDVGKLGVLLNS